MFFYSCFHLNSFRSYYLNIKTREMSTIVNKTQYLAQDRRPLAGLRKLCSLRATMGYFPLQFGGSPGKGGQLIND
jgi:hypothetical protein